MQEAGVIALVSVLDLDNTSFSAAIHIRDRGNSPVHAGHPKIAATEIITLRGVTNSVVSISLYDVRGPPKKSASSDWTAKHSQVLSDLIGMDGGA